MANETKSVVEATKIAGVTEAKAEDFGFLDEDAGAGFNEMDAKATSQPYLYIAQTNSDVVSQGQVALGNFYNGLTKKDYGNTVKMVVSYFRVVWVEYKPDLGGIAAMYEPGSIKVEGDLYKGMKNPVNGNEIKETWFYYVYLPDHKDDGYFIFSSTAGNMKYLKAWNTQMRYIKTPSGKPAPIYACIWEVSTGKTTNKKNQPFYACVKEGKPAFKQVGWVNRAMLEESIKPFREIAAEQQIGRIGEDHQDSLEGEDTAGKF